LNYIFFLPIILIAFARQIIRINDVNNKLIAMVCSTMPNYIRKHLVNTMQAIFGSQFGYTDTVSQESGSTPFPAYHFHYYNRYSTQV